MNEQGLTVAQLIEQLMKVENKEAKVFYERDSWCCDEIVGLFLEDGDVVLL